MATSPHLVTVPAPDGGPPIRQFNDAAIQALVDKALSNLDVVHGQRVEVEAFADGKSVRGAIAVKVGNNWSINAGVIKPYHGKLDGEVSVTFKF